MMIMTLDNHLSNKTFFETLLNETKYKEHDHPVASLGKMFLEENKNELSDLSYIRFAQGEVYYHNHDYEAAIFKWENITNELEAWAKKNVADAYCELSLLPTAVDTYKSIKTDNVILQTEIALKLFEIYIKENKQEMAISYIKRAVTIHPDYQDITEVARLFFEQNQDHVNAVELAVNEAIRTEKEYWFGVLLKYVEQGITQPMAPEYFVQVLQVVYTRDKVMFEQLITAMWKSYQQNQLYIQWIQCLNELLLQLDINESTSWKEISKLYEATFFDAVTGRYELKDITKFMPRLLENWTKLARPSQALSAYSAALTWNEFYPSTLTQETVDESNRLIWECRSNPHLMDDSVTLFQTLANWASEHNVDVDSKLHWFVQEILDVNKQNVLVVGVNDTGKSSFINSILGVELFVAPTSNTYRIQGGEQPRITVISEEGMYSESEVADLVQTVNYDMNLHSRAIMNVELPSDELNKYNLAIIDTPGFRGRREGLEVAEYFPLADYLLFVLDAEDPFTEQERDVLMQILEKDPQLPITFVVTKLDTIYNKQEAQRIVEDTYRRIIDYLPDAHVIAFSSKYPVPGQEKAVRDLFTEIAVKSNIEEKRSEKLLQIIRKTISYLFDKRVQKENSYVEAIQWNKDLVNKLNGSIHQVQDYEKEKAEDIRDSYHAITQEIKQEVEAKLPQLLKGCGSLIKEDSDFRKVHLEINDEMNRRIQSFFDESIMPRFYDSLENWILQAKDELLQGKAYLDDMSVSFNKLYGDEKVKLEGDFRILDDWQRDINRMTVGMDIERENIFLRHTPSQLLLKSAGKLLGAIPQNKTMLYNQYKKFIENEDYGETTQSVLSKFMVQFEVFEKAIDRDLRLFFAHSINELKARVGEAQVEIKSKEELLNLMRDKPEIYQDALTLFEIRLRQYEWMIHSTKEVKYV